MNRKNMPGPATESLALAYFFCKRSSRVRGEFAEFDVDGELLLAAVDVDGDGVTGIFVDEDATQGCGVIDGDIVDLDDDVVIF